MGWTCIIVAGLTGALLSIHRIDNFSQLHTTRFGIILSVKAVLFLLMVGIAMTTSLVIQKRLKRRAERQEERKAQAGEFLSHTELLTFDGTGSQPVYVAVDREVYDVSESPTWKEGRHMGQHFAGRDLSDALSGAPHGREVLAKYEKKGRLWEGQTDFQPEFTGVRKTFLILAKSALVISFLIIFCVALWRWG